MTAVSSERGFSLVEVLTAGCIIGLVLVFLVNGLGYSLQALVSSRENSALTSMLRAAVEETRATGYAALPTGTEVTADYLSGYDLVRTVSYVTQMANRQGAPVVKYVQVSLHRSPADQNPDPVVTVGFLLYQGGP